jgi:lipoic acid synthetase/lipoate-protein ligase A
VRQRITFLKDHTTLSLDEIKTMIRQTLCDGEVMLTNQQIKDIEQIESLKYNN